MTTEDMTEERRRWLAVLARAPGDELAAAVEGAGAPPCRVVRAAETGLVMVRGRAGGTGERFNLGEMTVSRCTVTDDEGRLGVGWIAGRDKRKAEAVARLDLLLQRPEGALLKARVVAPLAAAQAATREARAAKAAATKVEFFTMVRGDV
ncbi:phosphonate C-P lyase system protein PhnG [Zavarzinia aquatilis]|uniref:Phosphonate C-P lyase system protein PhnG n=1 Tax=Zavarzinia aquatilis TaxID=2211142 RepID=A0A317E463_9PROT|nr:phosphonate C-P lyase system protein PhnG [Zavarzinia aquatilis]PWR21431.1 phosphonate C-P lyase system protein PhnG [Zavarzinia aquatilis]